MRPVKEDRSFALYIILSILTCGIYAIFFFYYLVIDLNTVCEPMEDPIYDQQSPNYLLVFILGMLTCGIYTIFWLYKQGNRIQNVGKKYGLDIDENGTTLLLWLLLGSLLCGLGPLVSYYYFITNVNKLCKAYNRRYSGYETQFEQTSYDAPVQGISQNIPFSAPSNTCTLSFTCGALQGQSISLEDGEKITIGRDSSKCQLIIPDQTISRHHCDIQYIARENCCYIWDYSSYGVFIDGQRIQPNTAVQCRLGSKVSLSGGKNEFQIN